MSANWSIVYFESAITDDAFFNTAQEAFRLTLENKLYGLKYDNNGALVSFKLGDTIVEKFGGDVKRARLVQDGLINELYGHGILHYPQRNNLHVIEDSIIRLGVYSSGRIRREALKNRLQANPDPSSEVLFHMMGFLRQLSHTLKCQAVHVMFDRNPAGRGTGVHLYDSGELIDDYYYENIEAVGSELIEQLQNRDRVETFLNRRFAFLAKLPTVKHDPIYDQTYFYYFGGEDLPSKRESVHSSLNKTDLYVPFWEENTLPIGAIYCLEEPFPEHFLKRYER